MDVEIRPEPDEAQRDAILRVVAEQLAHDASPAGYRSAWREQGIRENTGDDAADEPLS